MSGTRVYYDLNNLRSLSDDELRQLSPRECAAASEQADQNIVRILQDIDAHFAAATRTVTDRLIPAVEAYGGSSKRSWDRVKVGQGSQPCFFGGHEMHLRLPSHAHSYGSTSSKQLLVCDFTKILHCQTRRKDAQKQQTTTKQRLMEAPKATRQQGIIGQGIRMHLEARHLAMRTTRGLKRPHLIQLLGRAV